MPLKYVYAPEASSRWPFAQETPATSSSNDDLAHLHMVLVYGRRPWLVPTEPEILSQFMQKKGRTVALRHGESLPLGNDSTLYWIEDGLLASVPLHQGESSRLCGLFGPGSVLGLVMALRTPAGNVRPMALNARALTTTRTLAVSLRDFYDWLHQQSGPTKEAVYRSAIAKTEAQLEGVFVNDIYPIPVRLLWALTVLTTPELVPAQGRESLPAFITETTPAAHSAGAKVTWTGLPRGVTLSDIAALTHTNREMISRTFAEVQKEGWVVRQGRRLWVNRDAILLQLSHAIHQP